MLVDHYAPLCLEYQRYDLKAIPGWPWDYLLTLFAHDPILKFLQSQINPLGSIILEYQKIKSTI